MGTTVGVRNQFGKEAVERNRIVAALAPNAWPLLTPVRTTAATAATTATISVIADSHSMPCAPFCRTSVATTNSATTPAAIGASCLAITCARSCRSPFVRKAKNDAPCYRNSSNVVTPPSSPYGVSSDSSVPA